MSGNSILNKAKKASNNDEFYTTYEIVEEELSRYAEQFNNKVVLCNCDDPFESNFCKYFIDNFNAFKLKKLICTSYGKSKLLRRYSIDTKASRIHERNESGYVLILDRIIHEEKDIKDIAAFVEKNNGVVKKLKGDGDFKSDECIVFLKECNICATNPPFSLFTDLFILLEKYKKKYILIGNQNALTYKEIFPYLMKNKTRIGHRFGEMAFRVPADAEPHNTRFWIDEDGQKWRSLGNAMWLTNLKKTDSNASLKLTQKYDPEKYPKFDNYDAIYVPRTIDIPMDYDGVMAVPITFLKYYDSKQFEIVGEANHGSDGPYDLFKPILNGKEKYKRLLVKNKRPTQ
jgi:cytosine-specific methyltransferase